MPSDKPSRKRTCPACRQEKPYEAFHPGDKNCGTCREAIVTSAAANNRRRAQVLAQKSKQGTP